MFVHFKKNHIINKKIIVTVIWIFSLLSGMLLLAIIYQELISERITNNDYKVNLEILIGVGLGIVLISGLLLKSKLARWLVLLLAYIALITPFVMFSMLWLFPPELKESFWTFISLPNIIMSLSIIYLLSNSISLQIYAIHKKRKSRIKEQIYLLMLSTFLIGMYIYYIDIPLLIAPAVLR